MQRLRPTPFDLVFETTAQTTFPAIRTALDEAGHDARNRDGFLMLREVVSLLRDLRPEDGLGEGIDQLAALVHHGYLFWAGGSLTVKLSSDQLPDFLRSAAPRELVNPMGERSTPSYRSGESGLRSFPEIRTSHWTAGPIL